MMLESAAVMAPVKTERPDDAEIQEMADKIRETNKAKMSAPAAAIARPLTAGINGQTTLAAYARATAAPLPSPVASTSSSSEKRPIDEDSQKGRFGWCSLGTVPLPYILRNGEKYCNVRMAELKILNKYLSYLSEDIYNYTNIRSYYITDAEARLLIDINMRHCDGHFGREPFTNKDLVVRLQDANEFHQFLEICYTKIRGLSNNKVPNSNRCGFIRINNDSVVPYTMKDGVKCVPLFYFEGETDALKQKAQSLEGWDLSYLKFCCKVQGIRNELFASETCNVISLDNIKSYFSANTTFDDYWPKTPDSQLISKTQNPVTNAAWTKQPVGGPVVTKATIAPKPPVVPARSYPANAASAIQGLATWNNVMSQQQSRVAQAYGRNWPPNGQTGTPYFPYQPNMIVSKATPPPLLRAQGMSPTNLRPVAPNVRMAGPGGAHYRAGYAVDPMDLTGQQMANGPRAKTRTPAMISDGQYYMDNEFIDGQLLPCLYCKSSNRREEPLIAIHDLTRTLFPNLQPMDVQKILQDVFKVALYKANRSQLDCLRMTGRYRNGADVALIKLSDATTFMPQLKYVVNHKLQPQQNESAKRMRYS